MKPLLSIVIPFYGKADNALLEHCLQSIKRQSVDSSEYEILIVDGLGTGNARNRGISQTAGDYLFFVDADDYLFKDVLAPLMEQLKEFRPDVLSFKGKKVYSGNVNIAEYRPKQPGIYTVKGEYMFRHNIHGSAWFYMVSKKLLIDYRISFQEGVYHEDEAFTAKVFFHAESIVATDRLVYAYFQNSSSTLHREESAEWMKRVDDFKSTLYSLRNYLNEYSNIVSDLQVKAIRRRIHFLTIDYIRQMKRNNCSISFIRRQMKELRKDGFFPLPLKGYSLKYVLACTPVNLLSL